MNDNNPKVININQIYADRIIAALTELGLLNEQNNS